MKQMFSYLFSLLQIQEELHLLPTRLLLLLHLQEEQQQQQLVSFILNYIENFR